MAESTMSDIMNPNLQAERDPTFPHAPPDWTRATAEGVAKDEAIDLDSDHWELVRGLQSYFAKHETPNMRELHDALDEKFHVKGGLKYLYKILPGGPVAQGCRLAGIEPPPGSINSSFGSVM